MHEYGIVMLAAVGFRGSAGADSQSDEVRSMLLDIVRNAPVDCGQYGTVLGGIRKPSVGFCSRMLGSLENQVEGGIKNERSCEFGCFGRTCSAGKAGAEPAPSTRVRAPQRRA